jgi:hypothetical protein
MAGVDEVPQTFTLATPSGGTHLVWQNVNGHTYKTCSGQVAYKFDVRAHGGQFVLWDPTKPDRFILDDRDPVPLPAWLAEFHPEVGSVISEAADIPDARAWLKEYGGGELCETMGDTLDKFLAGFQDGVAHDVMAEGVYALVGDCVMGHSGLNVALGKFRTAFLKAMEGKTRWRERITDWRNSIATAIAKKVARHDPYDEDPCEMGDIGPAIEKQKREKRNSLLLADMRSGSWLDDQDFPELVYAVPGLVPEGVVLLVGGSKIGKSTLVRRISLECARGGEVFGIGCDKRDVLYMALEDDDASMQLACRELLDGDPIPNSFSYLTEVKPKLMIPTVSAYLDSYPRGLVIVDVLGKAMEPALRGETVYERDYRIMTMLKTIAKHHPGSTTVVNHHSRKGKSEDWLEGVSGTNAIAGAADTIILLSRKRHEANGIWHVTSRKPMDDAEYAMILERPLGWRLDGDNLEDASDKVDSVRGGHTRKDSLGERSQEIIELLDDNPNGMSADDIADETGIPRHQIRVYLKRMWDANHIRKLARGRYGPMGKQKVSRK